MDKYFLLFTYEQRACIKKDLIIYSQTQNYGHKY